VTPQDDGRLSRSYWGLARTLVANLVIGTTDGFTRVLELVGTGYKVEAKGDVLVFNLGTPTPWCFPYPKGSRPRWKRPTASNSRGPTRKSWDRRWR